MKKDIIKMTLLGLLFFALYACKDTNPETAKIDQPKPVEKTTSVESKYDCSWCATPLKKRHLYVFTLEINGKIYSCYSWSNLLAPSPSREIENPFEGFFFCSLRCLNEFASSKLVVNKFAFFNFNSYRAPAGLHTRGGAPIEVD